MKSLLLLICSIILLSSVYAFNALDVSNVPSDIYLVAPQGRLYRAKRQFGGGFGASAANAGSQSFGFGPQGFNAAESLSGSQSYDFGGHHLSVGYAGSFSANNQGASGSFAPTYSFT